MAASKPLMILSPRRGFLFFIAFYRNVKAQKNTLMILSPRRGAFVLRWPMGAFW
jgi:hypothetical protein